MSNFQEITSKLKLKCEMNLRFETRVLTQTDSEYVPESHFLVSFDRGQSYSFEQGH